MDWELEIKEQTEELLAYYGRSVPVTLDYEHEETPLEVAYLDQWGFSTGCGKLLACDVTIRWVNPIECADQIIGSLFTFPLVDVID